MTFKPECGGRRPAVYGLSISLFKIPIIGPLLARLLGGGIGGKNGNNPKVGSVDTGGDKRDKKTNREE